MTKKLRTAIIPSFMLILISCTETTTNNTGENEPVIHNSIEDTLVNELTTEILTEAETVSKASGFLLNLETGEELSAFFSDYWTFIYHEDNRCDGSTDGQLDNLKKSRIDSVITLQVENDGDGWACDKKDPKSFSLDFDLMKAVSDWNRFEIGEDYGHQEEDIVYILGLGESDYLKLHYDENDLIIKLEYRSEDPG